MSKIFLTFILYLILQLVAVVVGLNFHREKEFGLSDVIKSWVFGKMTLYATLEALAVPMILFRAKFNLLFWTYILLATILFFFGLLSGRNHKVVVCITKKKLNPLQMILLFSVAILLLYQIVIYFFGIHLDEDDARWLAEANDAIEYGHMMTVNYDTGEYAGWFVSVKDMTSPWPLLFAILSKTLFSSVPIIAHTIYPPVALLIMYSIYWLIGSELFSRIETKLSFLLFVLIVNLFFGGTVYTQSAFSLVRIWQGKASVAGIIIPLLFYLFLRINRNNKLFDWVIVCVVNCAACLMSGMGISIAAIMIMTLGVYDIVCYKQWKKIPMLFLSVIPSIVYLSIYMMYRSII